MAATHRGAGAPSTVLELASSVPSSATNPAGRSGNGAGLTAPAGLVTLELECCSCSAGP